MYNDSYNSCRLWKNRTKEQTVLKAYNWVNYKTWQDMPVVGKGGSGGYTPFIEEIVGANPDVIICGYAQKDAEDLQNKTGIPVVAIEAGNLFSKEYDQSLKVIGKYVMLQQKLIRLSITFLR